MKKLGLWTLLLLGLAVPAWAQVDIEVRLEQDQFLPGEDLPIAVRITNRSGQTLHLGEDPTWLTFSIESKEGDSQIVPRTGDVPVVGAFDLASSKVAVKRLNLAPYFALTEPGRYGITATVQIKQWQTDVESPPCMFYLIDGPKLWQREVGIPTTNGVPEVRKYMLQQANYIRGQLRLYLRITDGSGSKTFKVFPVGPMISFSRPDPQVDRNSNLHLLYQFGPSSFSYTAYNPDGELLTRQTYDYLPNSRPRLQSDENGKLSVIGGVRHTAPNDFPPSETNNVAEPILKPIAAPTPKP